MALIFNGTNIREDVSNSLTYNGTNITSVVFNGTTVWSQFLFSGTWSGDSISNNSGLDTTGRNYRWIYGGSGALWRTVNINSGAFASSIYTQYGDDAGYTHSVGMEASGNNIRAYATRDYASPIFGSWISHSATNGFSSGSSYGQAKTIFAYFQTSGRQIRAGVNSSQVGAWITLS